MTSDNMPTRMAMPSPFAANAQKTTIANLSSGSSLSFPDGFSGSFDTPVAQGGTPFARPDINSALNLATNDLFYHKCGGLNTFDPAFANAVGGYPKGAVLQYIYGNNIYNVVSLVDNNTFNFFNEDGSVTIDNKNWAYCNQQLPTDNGVLVYNLTDYEIYPAFAGSSRTWNFGYIDVFTAKENGTLIASGKLTEHVISQSYSSSNIYCIGCGICATPLNDDGSIPILFDGTHSTSDVHYYSLIDTGANNDNRNNNTHDGLNMYATPLTIEKGKKYIIAYWCGSRPPWAAIGSSSVSVYQSVTVNANIYIQ